MDFSYGGVNRDNIVQAFAKYGGRNMSPYNPEAELSKLQGCYEHMLLSRAAREWLDAYRNGGSEDAEFMLSLESGISMWVRQCFIEERKAREQNETNGAQRGESGYIEPVNEAAELRSVVGRWSASMAMLANIVEIPEHHTDQAWQSFWRKYCAIYRSAVPRSQTKSLTYTVSLSDEVPVFTTPEEEPDGSGRLSSG